VLQPLTAACESCHLTNVYVSEGKPGKVHMFYNSTNQYCSYFNCDVFVVIVK